nr:muellerian-inhibiting factor [Anolis sagrei ordinatus]
MWVAAGGILLALSLILETSSIPEKDLSGQGLQRGATEFGGSEIPGEDEAMDVSDGLQGGLKVSEFGGSEILEEVETTDLSEGHHRGVKLSEFGGSTIPGKDEAMNVLESLHKRHKVSTFGGSEIPGEDEATDILEEGLWKGATRSKFGGAEIPRQDKTIDVLEEHPKRQKVFKSGGSEIPVEDGATAISEEGLWDGVEVTKFARSEMPREDEAKDVSEGLQRQPKATEFRGSEIPEEDKARDVLEGLHGGAKVSKLGGFKLPGDDEATDVLEEGLQRGASLSKFGGSEISREDEPIDVLDGLHKRHKVSKIGGPEVPREDEATVILESLQRGMKTPEFRGEDEATDSVGPRSKVSQPGQTLAHREVLGTLGDGFQPWSPEEPVCRVKLDQGSVWGPNHIEVVGLLTGYDSGFLKALGRSAWGPEEQEAFGICPMETGDRGLLSSLRQVGESLADPRESRFLLLHLEEVKWEAETKLRFKVMFQEEVGESMGPPQHALLVFYRGGRDSGSNRETFLIGGEGLHPEQVICLSRGTRFLVLQGSEVLGRHGAGHLSLELSLEIRRQSHPDVPLSSREAQDLLFGFDPKCFTRMTPMVLLLVKRQPGSTSLPPLDSSFLAAGDKLDIAPYLAPSALPTLRVPEVPPSGAANTSAPSDTRRFLACLSRFVHQILSPTVDSGSAVRTRLRLDFDTMEALPHLRLNLSEEVALERLVRSEDHLVVLFPEDGRALAEDQVENWHLEGPLLQQMMDKLREVIRDLKPMPAFQANAELFRTLTAFCYLPHGITLKSDGERGPRSKIHSLLLLKALQAMRAHWRESRRAHRSTRDSSGRRSDDYCQLRDLQVDLVSTGYIILPESYNANNCAGPCRSPLSTRVSDYYSHTIFLLRMQEQGSPLDRAPCCVPVKYAQSHMVTFTSDQGLMVKVYPDMVAKACGCR